MPHKASCLTKEQWRQDLQYLAKELPKPHKHAFHHITRAQFESDVAALNMAISSLPDHQIIVRVN